MNKNIFLIFFLFFIVFLLSFEKGIGKVVNKRKLQDDDKTHGMGNNTIEGGEGGEGGDGGEGEGGDGGDGGEGGGDGDGGEGEGGDGGEEGGETGKDEEELGYECSQQLNNTTCLSLELNTKDYHCCFITYNRSETENGECILNTYKEIYTESDKISELKIDCFSWKLMPSLFLILLFLVIFN